MFSNVVSTGLTLTKILSGLSKTISIANEAIPLYENVKPLLGSSKKIMKYFQNNKVKTVKRKENTSVKKTTITNYCSTNNPTFFK